MQLHILLRVILHNGVHGKQRQRAVLALPRQHSEIGVFQPLCRKALAQVLQGHRAAYFNKPHNGRLRRGNDLHHCLAGFQRFGSQHITGAIRLPRHKIILHIVHQETHRLARLGNGSRIHLFLERRRVRLLCRKRFRPQGGYIGLLLHSGRSPQPAEDSIIAPEALHQQPGYQQNQEDQQRIFARKLTSACHTG